MFDKNADPERIAARAAELALEQHDRFRDYFVTHPKKTEREFYGHPFEAMISHEIARLMGVYAVLKGYVPQERINP